MDVFNVRLTEAWCSVPQYKEKEDGSSAPCEDLFSAGHVPFGQSCDASHSQEVSQRMH